MLDQQISSRPLPLLRLLEQHFSSSPPSAHFRRTAVWRHVQLLRLKVSLERWQGCGKLSPSAADHCRSCGSWIGAFPSWFLSAPSGGALPLRPCHPPDDQRAWIGAPPAQCPPLTPPYVCHPSQAQTCVINDESSAFHPENHQWALQR